MQHSPPSSDAVPLLVRYLNKRYSNGTWANRDITLSAQAGEVLGILGPNGAGKSTLVRQITTELPANFGGGTCLGSRRGRPALRG